jgi:nitrate reductase NapE
LARNDTTQAKRNELKAFLFLTAVIVPLLAVAIVGAYGLIVWVFQLIAGPPSA